MQTDPSHVGRIALRNDPRIASASRADRVSEPSPMEHPLPVPPVERDPWDDRLPRRQVQQRKNTIPEAQRNHDIDRFLELLDDEETMYSRAIGGVKYNPNLTPEEKEEAWREYQGVMHDIDKAYERVKAGESVKAVKAEYEAVPRVGVLDEMANAAYDHYRGAQQFSYKWDHTPSTVKEIENAANDDRIRAQWEQTVPPSEGAKVPAGEDPVGSRIHSIYDKWKAKGEQYEAALRGAPTVMGEIDQMVKSNRAKTLTSDDNGTIRTGREVSASNAAGATPDPTGVGIDKEKDRTILSRLARFVGTSIQNLGNNDADKPKKPFNPFAGDPTVRGADIPFGPVRVRAYEKSDGTKVKGHERSRPGQGKKR